jgi:ATP-dependent DNA helicase 2 subunit 2
MLDVTDDIDAIQDVVQQMASILEDQIRHSFGAVNYDKVLEGLGVVREEMLGLEEPALYNDLLRRVKKKLDAGELGGNRADLWYQIRRKKLGLISSDVSQFSKLTQADANAFMFGKS